MLKLAEGSIRSKLIQHLREIEAEDALIVEEMGISGGRVIADVAVIKETLHGYEIKSHNDNFLRLPKQVKYYNYVFDTATLVYSGWQDELVASHIPEWWGMLRVDLDGTLITVREAQKNPKQRINHVCKLIWREEAVKALDQHGLARGFRGKARTVLWKRLAENVSQEDIKKHIWDFCKNRENWKRKF